MVVSFAIVDTIPSSVSLKEHMFPFEGAQSSETYLWGLYGTDSQNRGLFLADAYASRRQQQLLTVGLWYRVDDFDHVRSQITEDIANEFGFLHLDRLQVDYREQLRQFVLTQVRKEVSSAQLLTYESKTLDEIIVRHPKYVRSILQANRKINVLVHPVRSLYDAVDGRPLHIATVRTIRARIMAARVRYLEHIKVLY